MSESDFLVGSKVKVNLIAPDNHCNEYNNNINNNIWQILKAFSMLIHIAMYSEYINKSAQMKWQPGITQQISHVT